MEFIPHGKNRDPYVEKKGGEPSTFFTEDPLYAQRFAGETSLDTNRPKARIYPVKLKLEDVFNYRNKDHLNKLYQKLGIEPPKDFEPPDLNSYIKKGDPFVLQAPEVSKAIKDLGYSGYLTNETSRSGKRTVGLFYPDKGDVRSIFAKFDPEQSESGNIYASVGGGAFLGFGALEGLEDATND